MTVTVLGDALGIRDLYWQLTHNYKAQDGTEIGDIQITNLDGQDCKPEILSNPHCNSSRLSLIQS
jgi:hypothetical protein